MRRAALAFEWIVTLLRRSNIQFQVTGGLAARAYGSTRALADIDLNVASKDLDKIARRCQGHIVFGPDHHYIGDGIYTALRVLRVLVESKRQLSELAGAYRPFPQVLLNVPVPRQPPLEGLPLVARARKKIEQELGEDGRVLLRYSGTEPLARVMVEGPDLDRIRSQAQELADLIAAETRA